MQFGFYTTRILIETEDGLNSVQRSALIFKAKSGKFYRAPIGSESDGISSPPEIWPVLAPFGKLINGQYRGYKSGRLHDAAYRGTLQIYVGPPNCTATDLGEDPNWETILLDQPSCDTLIDEALESEGFTPMDHKLVYQMLREFGAKAFTEDRAALATMAALKPI